MRWALSLFARAALAVVIGAALGAGLGYLDMVFLAGRVSFAQTAAYQSAARLLVRYLPIAVNGMGGALLGGVIGFFLIRWAPWRDRSGRLFWTAIRGFILGGIAGALLGYADIAVLSHHLNLASSDNASAWRENRSVLVMINAGICAAAGFLLGGVVGWRR
jgi:cytosine/uracil/thiamine/allantoin permease